MRDTAFKDKLRAAMIMAALGAVPFQVLASEIGDANPEPIDRQSGSESINPRHANDYRAFLHALDCNDLEALAIKNQQDSLTEEWARKWAGIYVDYGWSTTRTELQLLPEAGVFYFWQECLGPCYQQGAVSESFPDGVRIRLTSDLCSLSPLPASSDWYFFEWDGQRCCLQLEQIINLIHACNATPMNEWEESSRRIAIVSRLQELGRDETEIRDDICGSPIFPEIFSDLLVREPLVVQIHSIDSGERRLEASDPNASSLRQFTAHLDILEGTLSVGRRFTVPGSGLWSAGIFTVESISTDSKRVSGILEILAVTPGYNAPPRHGTILRYPGSTPK